MRALRGRWHNRSVDRRTIQAAAGDQRVDAQDVQPSARQAARERPSNRRQTRELIGIRERERESAVAGLRVERRLRQGLFEGGEHGGEHRRKLERTRRRRDAAPFADEERVTQRVTQTGQGVAHRGRSDVQARRGTGDATFLQHAMEHAEQVEIELRYIHNSE